jgi:Holliday junction resolvase RusA-like endonuclease
VNPHTAFTLLIPGEPVGWQRARVNHAQRRHYDDPKTTQAKQAVVRAWVRAGQPRFEAGPLALELEAVLERPKHHYRAGGSLSSAGMRSSGPVKKPDADNVVKVVCDALNTKGYRDDAQLLAINASKRWQRDRTEPPHMRVTIRALDPVTPSPVRELRPAA